MRPTDANVTNGGDLGEGADLMASVRVLLVEDDDGDAFLVGEMLQDA